MFKLLNSLLYHFVEGSSTEKGWKEYNSIEGEGGV